MTHHPAIPELPMATVWRVDLDTDDRDYRTRFVIRAISADDALSIYLRYLANPPADYATISLIFDCRLIIAQCLHGDQEIIS
jgi:hypothetical protein